MIVLNRMETHAHSHYSNLRIIDSINRPKDMILTAKDLGLSGICLTDHEALCGAVEWLTIEKELKSNGTIPAEFKCGLGNEIYLVDKRDKQIDYYHFILIAKDEIGFRQLCKLSSGSWYNAYVDRGMQRVPTLKTELEAIIKENKGHVIATSACLGGELAKTYTKMQNGEFTKKEGREKIIEFLNFCDSLFGDDFYVEIAPSTMQEQIDFNSWALKFCKKNQLKMVYGTDAHYLTKKYRPIHKAYLNSKDGEREVDDFYAFAYLMANDEAYEYLKESGCTKTQFAEMCNNSMEIYDKITGYGGIFHNPIIPKVDVDIFPKLTLQIGEKYPVLKNLFSSDNVQERYWVNSCWNALLEKGLMKENYVSRLEVEADIIKTVGTKLGNCMFEYFNTFQHFIDLFWDCGSLSGPGRGSSVCFLSNFLLGITQLDPLEWGLAEWRFLNKERMELPDIDTDLSPTKRPLILKKIREERGELRLLQVATFGTEATRSAIKAACRGYRSEEIPDGIDIDTAMYLSSLIPSERGFLWSFADAYYGNEEKGRVRIKQFVDEIDKYDGLKEIIETIEGLVNSRGQHASGVILYNEDPWNTGAVMRSPNGDLITQFSLHDAEKMGDTKFDFLVTEVCDMLSTTIDLLQKDGFFNKDMTLRQIYEEYLHPSKINLNDSRLWDTLEKGNVVNLFQFDSDVGALTIKNVKPRTPIELMMANALIRLTSEKGKERPVERYIRMKNDINQWYNECRSRGLTEEEIKIIEPYYLPVSGCPTTQEKLMMLCMEEKLSHFTLSEANTARKICAKKLMSKIPELHEKFVSQCPRRVLGEYVWETAVLPQMSYSFAEPCNGVNTLNQLSLG